MMGIICIKNKQNMQKQLKSIFNGACYKVFLRKLKSLLEIVRTIKELMKNMLVQSIKKLKRQKQMNNKQKSKKSNTESYDLSIKASPKKNTGNEFSHREKKNVQKGIFTGYSFCFPIADSEISRQQIQILSESIMIEGGKVVEFKQKQTNQEVDFLLINPILKPEIIHDKVHGRLNYKEMLDYNFITDCFKEGTLKNFEKYSLFVNISEFQSEEKSGKKKVKRESDNDTEKLPQDEEGERRMVFDKEKYLKHQTNIEMKDEKDFIPEKEQMQDIMLTHKNIGDHGFSMNKFIADELTKLMKIYATQRDTGRKIAYMKASAVIKNLDKEIESQKDVQNIKGIGKKISDKIKELLETGKIQKLEKLQGSEKNIILGQFCKIWGVGPSKAQQIYNTGIKTIDELRKRTDFLTKNQKIGLKYFDDFQQKIPREKITKMFEYVKQVIKNIVPSLDMYKIQVCGSYRRGKATCGDMDIIISRKDGTYQGRLLCDIVQALENIGFLTDHLTTPKPSDSRSSISYMGVCQFEGPIHHRIDIKYYPYQQFAYAILYFTGSGTFNRMMRLHCMKLGLNLSDHGATPKNQKGVIWTRPIPTCFTQEDIFTFLGLDYKTPKERDM